MRSENFRTQGQFCRWFLQLNVDETELPRRILFTYEATFTREGIFNSRNKHFEADENSRATPPPQIFQQRYSIDVWAEFLDGRVIGPYLLPLTLMGDAYLIFLEYVLHGLLKDLPLHVPQNMWFQHYCSTPHFSLAVRRHLYQRFGQT